MKLTDILGLPYPEVDDSAALALYMEDLAFKLEDLLSGVNDAFTDIVDRPCVYVTNLVATPAINGSSTITWDFTAPQVWQGDVAQPSVDSTRIPFPSLRTGLWLVGATTTSALPAAGPTVNTWRSLSVNAFGVDSAGQFIGLTGVRPDRSDVFDNGSEVYGHNWETNTAGSGETNSVQTIAYVPPGATEIPGLGTYGEIQVRFYNDDNTSAINLPAGSLFAWAVWLGYGSELIEQIG